MDVVPVRPHPPMRPAPRTPGTKTATHAPAKAPHPAGPEDLELLAQQAAFDRMVQMRAELEREANALRDLAMEQVKRDDQTMKAWIKLI